VFKTIGGTRFVAWAVCFGCVSTLASAEGADAQVTVDKRHSVRVSGTTGWALGGPGSGFEAMLEAAGFGDFLTDGCVTPDDCVFGTDYPETEAAPGPGSNLRVAYAYDGRFVGAFNFGTARMPRTSGYSQVLIPDFGRYSEIWSNFKMMALTVGARYKFMEVSAGPARYSLVTEFTDEDYVLASSTESKMGFVVEGGAALPLYARLFLELRGQYRAVGETEIGPYQISTRTIPATPVDFSHLFLAFGVGLAF
jgi:hypothetical protein